MSKIIPNEQRFSADMISSEIFLLEFTPLFSDDSRNRGRMNRSQDLPGRARAQVQTSW